jgi:hypothetical protein
VFRRCWKCQQVKRLGDRVDSISPALMGRDELSGSIFGENFLLVTSPDSDGTVLPFDRGPAKLLTASMQSLKLLPFDHGQYQIRLW